ncbi:MAG: BlaI/MecI/CopY family transcriptional regulator [Cyclobacteriaceae bacterium]|nr:BlaI/MecI/CopY family transcriptional regulator [Cyclobacteriaceae bacterium]
MLRPSDAELEILKIVWQNEPVTVREVHEEISKNKKVKPTTTLKQMQRMTDKDLLRKIETDKVQRFVSNISEKETRKNLMDRLLETAFGGSAKALLLEALGSDRVSLEELKELKTLIKSKEDGAKGHD